MKKNITDIYHLVDEDFISKFNPSQASFMKKYYYNHYKSYCIQNKIKPLSQTSFFTNMRRRKIKLIQVCCPYCGNMNFIVVKGALSDVEKLNYCTHCGKRSAFENAFFQVSRLIRIQHFHSRALELLKEEHTDDKLKIMSYDIYQLELIELTSILEVSLRDFFVAFVYLYYKNSRTTYIDSIIHMSIGNDFMNVEKANNHYKKALGINLRELISKDCWENLVDVVQIRNTLVHNNGIIDNKFRKSKTFSRINSLISGDLIFLDNKDIDMYLKNVIEIINAITETFNSQYRKQLHFLISNYYFNISSTSIRTSNWISLKDAITETKLKHK